MLGASCLPGACLPSANRLESARNAGCGEEARGGGKEPGDVSHAELSESLPVDALRSQVEETLGAGLPLVVQAPTGSGKSTRLPLWCPGRVLVVEPRRVACRSLARWMSAQQGTVLGEEIGYAVRFESVCGEQTRVLLVTPGVALNEAASGALERYQVIIVDEFHERGLETDLFLAAARRLAPEARVVVMSATLRAERLVPWLGARLLTTGGRIHPVEIRHLGGPTVPSAQHLADRVTQGVQRALRETSGNILVFLPGKGDIADCLGRLKRVAGVEVLPLHGSLSHAEQDRVFEPGGRRVVLSTNVAETSVTLPGVTAVVDSGLVRQRRHRGGHPTLAVIPVSRASADQRAGRAGRVAPGVCYRLWDARAVLEAETPPEILREDLGAFVLAVSATGLRPEDLDFLDAPPAFAVERAQEQLRAWHVLDPENRLTPFGRRLHKVPLDAALARLVVEAPPGLRADVIDLVASLEARSPLERSDLDDDLPRCDGVRNIVALRRGGNDEAHRVADQLRGLYGLPALRADHGRLPARAALVAFLLRAWPERAYVRRARGGGWGNGNDEVTLARGSQADAEAMAAIMLDIEALGDRGLRVRLSSRAAMPCTLSDLRQAGIGRASAGRILVVDDEIVGEVTWTHAGRELGREVMPLCGSVLREALAELVLDGRLLPGVGDDLVDTLGAWALHRALEDGPGSRGTLGVGAPLPEPRAWLLSRLEALGVEAPSDHLLLTAADLAHPRLDPLVAQELDRRFPRQVKTASATWRVEYDVPRKRVTLHWEGGQRHPLVSLSLLPRWPGWEVQACERGRVTGVR